MSNSYKNMMMINQEIIKLKIACLLCNREISLVSNLWMIQFQAAKLEILTSR